MDWQSVHRGILPLDEGAVERARERQDRLVKPAGSLGVLEDISVRFAGITGKVTNTARRRLHVVFGADNGVYAEGVAAAPQAFTLILMENYARGGGGINALCNANGVDLRLCDIGITGAFAGADYARPVENHKLMQGTRNIRLENAMDRGTAEQAAAIGFSYAKEAREQGYRLLSAGEVGMANTTTSAACVMAALGIRDAAEVTGRGAGLSDEAFEHKKTVIADAVARAKPDPADPFDVVQKVGGLDIAAMMGFYIGAAYYRLPVVTDGIISMAAALLAYRFHPLTADFMFASHISREPAHRRICGELRLTPVLDLHMRLGEGSGCPLAMALIESALAAARQMRTFDELRMPTDYQESID